MQEKNFYTLPPLPYGRSGLNPYISDEQLSVHYEKHHNNYVEECNKIFEEADKKRRDNLEIDMKAISKEFGFNAGGHILHSIFWKCLAPSGRGRGEPSGKIKDLIEKEFLSFEKFKKEFSAAAFKVEGSGWAAIAVCPQTQRPLIMQIEKHNFNVYPAFKIIMLLDMFEHAYYINYKNDKAKYIEGFWDFVNWEFVNRNLGF
ncbi:MAG: superoxide dismutase [bacterium]